MRTWLKQYLCRRRLLLYRRLLTETPLDISNVAVIGTSLASIWRQIQPGDLIDIQPVRRSLTVVNCWTKNIVELVELLKIVNQQIHAQGETGLELKMSQYQEKRQVSLDFFLADDNLYPIDELAHLRKLRGLLQEHVFLLKKQENQYYQRLSTKCYSDIVELTNALVRSQL